MTFGFSSGRPSLDFVGTRKWRRSNTPEEHLEAPIDFTRWTVAAGLVDDAPTVTAEELAKVIQVRESLYRTLSAAVFRQPASAEDITRLNRVARKPGIAMQMRPDGDVTAQGAVTQVLSTLVRDAFDLLAHAGTNDIRECANDACTRLYLDTSRGRTRRWCGMAECGNRAKAARFRNRHRDG